MRLGFVYLAIAVGVPMAVAGQSQPRMQTGLPSDNVVSNRSMARADGSMMGGTFRDGSYVELSAPAAPQSDPGAISFRHYAHQPVKAARKSFEKAVKAIEKDQQGEALDRLNEAVQADPEFFDAQLETAIVWITQEKPAEALPHLEKALAIDASSQLAQGLAAWVLLQLDRAGEAEAAARRSLQLGRTVPILEQLMKLAQARRKAQWQISSNKPTAR